MALRLLEVTVPEDRLERIPALVADLDLIQSWEVKAEKGLAVARFLLEADDVEALSDALMGGLGSPEQFRLILLPVEATLPIVREEPAPKQAEGKGEEAEGREPPANKPGPERISREELYEDVSQASKVTPVYLVMVALSSVVAAVGLLRGDVAIIIGAMVIAPLLGPNVALSLASTLGDLDLARRSMKAIASGVATAAAVSLLVGLVFTVDPSTPELAARTQAGLGDIVIALAAGSAGSLAFTSGVPAIVVGVMVAVALLPPLVVAGLLIGAGYLGGGVGALMLLVINVTCINLAAVATFLVQQVRPRTWWEADRAKRSTRIAVATWILTLALLLFLIWLRHLRGI